MKQLAACFRQHPAAAGLAPALLACFLFLVFRNGGIYPIVFIDEWIYNSAARMLPLADAQVPSYLYFALYSTTNFCGDGYLECNRLLNALFYVAAGPLIYLLARRVAAPWAAGLAAVAAVLAPANALTPYFMPEAMYFFAFWLVCWTCMWVYDRPQPLRAAVLGGLLGLMAMVKLHAIFVVPAACVFLVYAAGAHRVPGQRWRWLRAAALLCALLLAAFAAIRFGVGYALAGKNGLYLLGKLYADQAAYTARAHLPYLQLLALGLNNLRGQLLLLAILFGVPLAALAAQLLALCRSGPRRDPVQALAVLCLLMLGSALLVTVAFTASITGLGAMETAQRIHTRYYNFALPLLLLCGAAVLRAPDRPGRGLRLALAVLLAAAAAYGWHMLLRLFTPNLTDSPELQALTRDPLVFALLCALGAATLALWAMRPVLGARAFFLLFLPLATGLLAALIAQQVRVSRMPDAAAKAGIFVHHYLDSWQTGRLTIVSDDIANLHRARFFVQNPAADLLQTPQGAPVPWDKLAPGKGWVLVLGDYRLPDDARVVAHKDQFTLMQTGTRSVAGHELSFAATLPGEYVQRVGGLAGAESWGSWSDGPGAHIQFTQPLPARMRLRLAARAFGPNVDKEFVLKMGGQQRAFRLGRNSSVVTLEFDNPDRADTLEFLVPAPASPFSLGLGEDRRELGIGLESLKIEALP